MIKCNVADRDTTSNIDWAPITAEQLSKPSVMMVLLEKILQNEQSGGHKVLIFSHMVCVLDFLEDLLGANSTNMKVLMDQSPPHIGPVLLISFSPSRIKGFS